MLSDLNVLGFNTNKVKGMQGIFMEMESLTSINLATFNLNNVKTVRYMFKGDINLKRITFGKDRYLGKNTDSEFMFEDCIAEEITIFTI